MSQSQSVLHAGLEQLPPPLPLGNEDQLQLWGSGSGSGSDPGSGSPLRDVILQDRETPNPPSTVDTSNLSAALKTCGEYCDTLGCRTMRAKHVRRLVCTTCMPVGTYKTWMQKCHTYRLHARQGDSDLDVSQLHRHETHQPRRCHHRFVMLST